MNKTKHRPARRSKTTEQEVDSIYFLKLVMYLILGCQWLRIVDSSGNVTLSLPIGLAIGMAFALHDHFQIDRKIEFAVLLIATLVGYFAYIGLSFSL